MSARIEGDGPAIEFVDAEGPLLEFRDRGGGDVADDPVAAASFELRPEPLSPARVLARSGEATVEVCKVNARMDELLSELERHLEVDPGAVRAKLNSGRCEFIGIDRPPVDAFTDERTLRIFQEMISLVERISEDRCALFSRYAPGYKSRIDKDISPYFGAKVARERQAAEERVHSRMSKLAEWMPFRAPPSPYKRIAEVSSRADAFDTEYLEGHLSDIEHTDDWYRILGSLRGADAYIAAYKDAVSTKLREAMGRKHAVRPDVALDREIERLQKLQRNLEELDIFAVRVAICHGCKVEKDPYALQREILDRFSSPTREEAEYAIAVGGMIIEGRLDYMDYCDACGVEERAVPLEEHFVRLAIHEGVHEHREFSFLSKDVQTALTEAKTRVASEIEDFQFDGPEGGVSAHDYIAAFRGHERVAETPTVPEDEGGAETPTVPEDEGRAESPTVPEGGV